MQANNFEAREMIEEKIQLFKDRKIKAKSIFTINQVEKTTAYEFIRKYHYLSDAKFFSKFSYGLFIGNILVGCATYSNPQGISTLKGWFSLKNSNQSILELSRLCMLPSLNGCNATSYLLGGSIRMLKAHDIRAVITLADNSRHSGAIYQVCNFKYYGKTDKKTDFYCADGRKNPRGRTKDLQGVWLQRSRKHRYAYLIDNNLRCNYKEEQPPKKEARDYITCCGGSGKVVDKRYSKEYDCPICKAI